MRGFSILRLNPSWPPSSVSSRPCSVSSKSSFAVTLLITISPYLTKPQDTSADNDHVRLTNTDESLKKQIATTLSSYKLKSHPLDEQPYVAHLRPVAVEDHY